MSVKAKAYASGFIAKKKRFRRDYASKRYAIKINGIHSRYKTYESKMKLESRELIPNGCKATMIAIYAQHINDEDGSKAMFKYHLSINGGKKQEIKPVNQQQYDINDIVFIRKAAGQDGLVGTLFIDDYITSAVLSVSSTYQGSPVPLTGIRVVREMESDPIVQ